MDIAYQGAGNIEQLDGMSKIATLNVGLVTVKQEGKDALTKCE
jgi:hypothetical protein